MLHYGSVGGGGGGGGGGCGGGRAHSKATLYLHIHFWHFYVIFHQKICVFIISISFF